MYCVAADLVVAGPISGGFIQKEEADCLLFYGIYKERCSAMQKIGIFGTS